MRIHADRLTWNSTGCVIFDFRAAVEKYATKHGVGAERAAWGVANVERNKGCTPRRIAGNVWLHTSWTTKRRG